MAGVFLSYDHEDVALARPLVRAFENAGHTVWFDRQVHGGAQYSRKIEQALEEADAVVVLWTARSLDSAWVRDEAAEGRDRGKLVPLSLGGVTPPMGFRQFQTVDLGLWKGRGKVPRLRELLEAIRSQAGEAAAERHTQAVVKGPALSAARQVNGSYIGAATVLSLGVVGGWWLLQRSEAPLVVAVQSADPSPQSQALVRDLFVKLGRLQAANPDALEIVADRKGKSADFTFQVSASPTAERAAASVSMLGPDRALLWSNDFERPADQYSDLKQQLALTAARVVGCATEAVTNQGGKLNQQTLKLYLNGCANLAEIAGHDFRELVPVFREVTRRVPGFEDGWAKLLTAEASVIGWESIPKDSAEGRALAKDIAAARKLNPRMPEAYGAEFVLAGEDDLAKQAGILERASRASSDDPKLLGMRVALLRRVGRMKEAVENASRAADLDPLDPGVTTDYIEALTYAGQRNAALAEIEKARRLWPDARIVIGEASFRFHLRYGDPREALRIIRTTSPEDSHFESLLMARIDPSKENVGRAIADARAQVGRSPRGIGWLVVALAQFGQDDMIYSIVENPRGIAVSYLSDAFFRPEFHHFRQNPRFMKVANDLGLISYWQTSGKWPDFCFEPDLPYDCKAEAAKLT